MKYIDLTVPLSENTPVYPGDPATVIKPAGVLADDGYCDHYISLGTHVGTHIDAPMHMIQNGKSLDSISIEQFIGPGKYIDARNGNFSAVKDTDIEAGDIVLLHTNMASQYHNPIYFEDYPAIPDEIADYLISKKVKMVGVDMCSPDHEPFPIHKKLLGNNILIIENLTNLDKLAGKQFTVYALPIKLDIDGAPARVIAVLN